MSILNVGEVWDVTIGCYTANQIAFNGVKYVVGNSTGSGATDTQLAQAVDNATRALYQTILTSAAAYWGVKVIRRTPAPSAAAAYSTLTASIGSAGSKPLPTQTAGLLKLHSTTFGRKGRGRIFLPFPDEADITGTVPTSGYITQLEAIGAALLGLETVGTLPNTAAILLAVGNRSATGTYAVVSSTAPGSQFATQRRRGGYGKINVVPPWATP
jgi:hypothetical protein